ncbi:MAG: HNH endonuclease [Candidatus Gracilibacteria bacterium]|nr:HNH endonuclease [Candidatus Gracilibacteria bacterium]
MTRIEESHLILPALYLMYRKNDGYISTSELKEILPIIMKPKGEDLEKSNSRPNESKFLQIIGNLKSHKSFLKNNFAIHEDRGFKITEKGKLYLLENYEVTEYLIENDFDWDDIKEGFNNVYTSTTINNKKIELFDENILINEGIQKVINVKTYNRSDRLRNIAINHFKKSDGKLYCECCSFCFDLFYGAEISKNYIEIHHKRPIFQYEGEDINVKIENALNNLSPLCSNCHRMIHRDKNTKKIDDIVVAIKTNGVFYN